MKRSQLEVALLRKGINPDILRRMKKDGEKAWRQTKEHPLVKVERLKGKPYHRRPLKKPRIKSLCMTLSGLAFESLCACVPLV